MPTLTKDQVKKIIDGAPQGTKPRDIVEGLVKRGYTLEGLNGSAPETTGQKVLNLGIGLAKDVATPFVTAGVTGLAAAQGTRDLVAGGIAKAVGAKDYAQKMFSEADRVTREGYNVPGFGQVSPVGSTIGQPGGYANEVKRMVGTGAGIASTVAGGGGAASFASNAGKGLVKNAVIQGAKQGLYIGGIGGLGSSLQNPNSTAGDVALSTIAGAGLGGVVGGALGPLAARSTQAGRAAIAAQKAENQTSKITDFIAPVLSKSEKIAAFRRGQGVAPTLFKEGTVNPSNYEKEIAKAVSKVVNTKKSYVENIDSVSEAISTEAKSLADSLGKNNVIFNKKQLGAKLNAIEPPAMVQSDQQLSNAYAMAKQKFMAFVDEEPKNMTGLLSARQKFDAWISREYPNIWEDPRTKPLQRAFKDMRNSANDFIAEKLPEGSKFLSSLRKQSLMFDALDNMAERAVKENMSKAVGFTKKYPLVKEVAKYASGGVLGAYGANKILGD